MSNQEQETKPLRIGNKTKYNRSIILGASQGEIHIINLQLGSIFQNPYVSFTHDSYNDSFIDEEQGFDLAREIIDEESTVETWKDEVQNDYTLAGFEDWKEEYADRHNWYDVIADVVEIDYDLYTTISSCGAGFPEDDYNELKIPKLTKEEFDLIKDEWNRLHLKMLKDLTIGEKKRLHKVIDIFNKYKDFDTKDLKEFKNLDDKDDVTEDE